MNFMYGLECEYPIEESEKILEFYQPVFTNDDQWENLSFSEKSHLLNRSFPSFKDKEQIMVLKNPHPLLPKHLVKDDTGNLEFVFSPVGSKNDLQKQIDFLEKYFGLGLLQGLSLIHI